MDVDGRAVCPACGRLSSRLAAMEPPTAPDAPAPEELDRPVATDAPTTPTAPPPPRPPVGEPQQLGTGRLAPAPLPEPEQRTRWALIVPIAAACIALLAGIWFVALRPGDDEPAPATTRTTAAPNQGTVDIGDVDDPTTTAAATSSTAATSTTARAASTTTTAAGPVERVDVSSGGGLSWTMQAAPSRTEKAATRVAWTATEGDTTEVVDVTELGSTSFDVDQALARFAASFEAPLDGLRDSHLALQPGRTASFTGTLDGEPVVGWLVGAQVGQSGVVVATYRVGGDLNTLYPEFLALPASVSAS